MSDHFDKSQNKIYPFLTCFSNYHALQLCMLTGHAIATNICYLSE